MTDITLKDITSGYNVSRINYNFDKIEYSINNEILHLVGGNNVMQQDLDMNSNSILNVVVDPDDGESLITLQFADDRYLNASGDSLEGTLDAAGNKITGLPAAQQSTDAVRKQEFDAEIGSLEQGLAAEIAARADADANLQNQLTGNIPLEASAFSVISWHDQSVDNSVNIPANKNAWSFGPTMTISPGQTVTVGTGSFWTVANGEVS